ncbi:MAG TPA: aminoglycoside phosphotransferase family protein [Candidatus Dormibacteraeota bacterium]|nr:aminoglycoside phosphotransferase family protein [Candidatus Dormibacteraeota bacterium]
MRSIKPLAGGITGAVLAFDAPDVAPRRFVLKLYRPDPEEPDSAGREARVLELLAPTQLPLPRVMAMDREGTDTVWPALLMTRMPGRRRFRPREVGPWLEGLARLAARIQSAAVPPGALPEYRLWGASDPLDMPEWWTQPEAWRRAVDVFRGPAPQEGQSFIHRDFHPGNVLWKGRRPSAIVDWLHGCRGPVAVDVAHCRVNLWLDNGPAVADAWLEACGVASHHPYWDIADALSWIPNPRVDGMRRARRYESFIVTAVSRLS